MLGKTSIIIYMQKPKSKLKIKQTLIIIQNKLLLQKKWEYIKQSEKAFKK